MLDELFIAGLKFLQICYFRIYGNPVDPRALQEAGKRGRQDSWKGYQFRVSRMERGWCRRIDNSSNNFRMHEDTYVSKVQSLESKLVSSQDSRTLNTSTPC